MKFLTVLRRLASRLRDRDHRPEVDAFEDAVARLQPGDVAIDCGANVGKFTLPMARSGAEVYAFEPNPVAFAELKKVTAAYPNVTLFQAAVTTEAGPVKLFLHKRDADDPMFFSTSSSLLAGKRNVREDRYEVVEGRPFLEFLRSLGDRRVRLLKMDIEGAEVGVLNQLLDEGWQDRIDEAFVEVHGRQIRSLAKPTRQLEERLRALGALQFRLDWR